MKKDTKEFIKAGLAFWLIFAASLVLVNSTFDYVVFHHSYAFEKASTFEKFTSKNKHIDYLFMGDSHTQDDVSPSKVSSRSFNMGLSGEGYRQNYYKLKSTLEKNITVDYVVLEVDDTMQDTPGGFEKEIFFVRKYVPLKDVVKLKPAAIINYYFGFLGRGLYFGLAVTEGKPMDEFGFAFNDHIVGDESKMQVLHPEAANATYQVPEYLIKIIELCRMHDQKIIFIKYPLLPEDQHHLNHDQMIETYLANETLLDYRSVFDNNRTLFQNLNHLNIDGANVLSGQIKVDLENLKK